MRKLSIAIILTLILIGQAGAVPILDQQQTLFRDRVALFDQSDIMQSFQTQADNVAGASLGISEGSGTGPRYTDITISLYDGHPLLGGSLLRTGTDYDVYASPFSQQDDPEDSWANVFWDPVAVTPNTDLFLLFESSEWEITIAGATADIYQHGMFHQGFTAHPLADLAFKTYTEPVPEPATIILLSSGIVGLIGFRKRSKRS